MMRAKRPVLATALATSMMLTSLMPMTASAGNGVTINDRPGEMAMIGDAAFARPFLIVSTLAGAAIFTVTLPFTAIARSTDEAADTLVRTPGRAAFIRCLGCTPAQQERLIQERELEKNREIARQEAANQQAQQSGQ